MTLFKRIFHFLGGIYFAISLILLAAGTVILGTLLESFTDSHRFAAQWTYEHPLFLLLLCLFFINILFSALRRWPFKRKHLPFLITHFGLLMIIGGTFLKNRFGVQGHLVIWEGSENHHLLLPHTHALYLEKKGESPASVTPHLIPLNSFRPNIYFPTHCPHLKCKLIGYAPHVQEELETWIKGTKAYIAGLPPLDVYSWEPHQPLPNSLITRLPMAASQYWNLLALHTSHIQQAVKELYLRELTLRLKAKDSLQTSLVQTSLDIPLQKALQHPFSFAGGTWILSLDLPSALHLQWQSEAGTDQENFTLPLQGQEALYTLSDSPYRLAPSFTIDLIRPIPQLCLMQDEQKEIFLFAFDPYGRFHVERFHPSSLQTLIAYDQGFAGYAIQAILPIPSFPQTIQRFIKLETPLTTYIRPETPPLRLEDHRPGIVLEVQQGERKQVLALSYDASGNGLKWPILNGAYTIRFQPMLKELPYRIRLRQARQLFYPQSSQVYSYESDLLITEKGQEPVAQTLSMNRVYETWGGYRFYLAGMASSADQGIKRIQLIVNYDPAKYLLTYPGAALVFLGILLLFWVQPYRQ